MLVSKKYFDTIADRWDMMQESFFSTDVREFAYTLAGIEEGKTAADIGAGTGFMTHGLLSAGLHVIAIDQSEEMLTLLKKKYAKCSELICLAGDSDALPLESNSMDYVFANMLLHHIQNPLVTIKEIYRVLKPNGIFILTDLDAHEFKELQSNQHDVWMGFEREDIKQWFKEAGFKNPTTHCVGNNCCTKSTCSCNQADISISIFAAMGRK